MECTYNKNVTTIRHWYTPRSLLVPCVVSWFLIDCSVGSIIHPRNICTLGVLFLAYQFRHPRRCCPRARHPRSSYIIFCYLLGCFLKNRSSFAKCHLQKMGWIEGTGLGKRRDGIVDHVKIKQREEVSRGCVIVYQ
jgi:hypothetical protein